MYKLIASLAVILVAGVLYFYAPAVVACLAGALIFGLLLRKAYTMGRDDGRETFQDHVEESNDEVIGFNNTSALQSTERLNSTNHIIEQDVRAETNLSSQLYTGLSDFFDGFFYSPSKKNHRNTTELRDAITKCREECDNQNAEVRTITNALKEFKQEARFLSEQSRETQLISNPGCIQITTKPTSFIASKHEEDSTLLLAALCELMNNYPKSTFKENPCIESVHLYAEERRAHHENILSIAIILLPELHSLLNEAKITRINTMTAQGYPI